MNVANQNNLGKQASRKVGYANRGRPKKERIKWLRPLYRTPLPTPLHLYIDLFILLYTGADFKGLVSSSSVVLAFFVDIKSKKNWLIS